MANRTDGLDVEMMIGTVPLMMIVLVPALTVFPFVAAVDAGQGIRMGTTASPNLDVNPLASLLLIAITRRVRSRPGKTGYRVNSKRHRYTPHFAQP